MSDTLNKIEQEIAREVIEGVTDEVNAILDFDRILSEAEERLVREIISDALRTTALGLYRLEDVELPEPEPEPDPVLDADGNELNVGDTVRHINGASGHIGTIIDLRYHLDRRESKAIDGVQVMWQTDDGEDSYYNGRAYAGVAGQQDGYEIEEPELLRKQESNILKVGDRVYHKLIHVTGLLTKLGNESGGDCVVRWDEDADPAVRGQEVPTLLSNLQKITRLA